MVIFIVCIFVCTEIATSTTRCQNCFTVRLSPRAVSLHSLGWRRTFAALPEVQKTRAMQLSKSKFLSSESAGCFRTDLSWAKTSCASEILRFQAQKDSAACSIWRKLSQAYRTSLTEATAENQGGGEVWRGTQKTLLKAGTQSDHKDMIFCFILIISVLEVTFLYFL